MINDDGVDDDLVPVRMMLLIGDKDDDDFGAGKYTIDICCLVVLMTR